MRERRSVRELSDKEKKKTLDTAGVVRDGSLIGSFWLREPEGNQLPD